MRIKALDFGAGPCLELRVSQERNGLVFGFLFLFFNWMIIVVLVSIVQEECFFFFLCFFFFNLDGNCSVGFCSTTTKIPCASTKI